MSNDQQARDKFEAAIVAVEEMNDRAAARRNRGASVAPCQFGTEHGWRIAIPHDAPVEIQYAHSRFIQLRPHPENSYGIDQRGDVIDVLRADLARVTAERDAFGNAILPDHHDGWDAESLARLATCHRTDSENIDAIERECHEAQARAEKAEAALAKAQQRWEQATETYYVDYPYSESGPWSSIEGARTHLADQREALRRVAHIERVTTLRERIDPPQEP